MTEDEKIIKLLKDAAAALERTSDKAGNNGEPSKTIRELADKIYSSALTKYPNTGSAMEF